MIRKKHIAATVAALFCFIAMADMPALEIKGLAPGQTSASISARPGWKCEPPSKTQSTLCSSRTETLAGIKTKAIFTTIWLGRAIDAHAIFSATDFLDVRAALLSKYGQPKIDPQDPTSLEWTNGNRVLQLRLHSAVGQMTSSLSLTDNQTAAKKEEASKAKATSARTDL